MSNELFNLKIKIIGVGGGGNNMIEHLYENYLQDFNTEYIDLIAVNTDIQVLNNVNTKTLAIGKELTHGLGAGMRPEVGEAAALENYQELVSELEDADMVFIACGMGGGTGTGAAPIIAKAAKETGALTISIATKPFSFEGKKRKKYAVEGLKVLEENTDSLIVIENDKLLKMQNPNLSFKLAFKMVDNVLAKAVQGIIGIVLDSGKNDINVDFADLKTILSYSGYSVMSMAVGIGETAALEAVEKSLSNQLLSYSDISGSKGVLIHFAANSNYPLDKLYEAMHLIEEKADDEADIIFGTSSSVDMDENEVAVTLIATGFKTNSNEDNRKKIEENISKNVEATFENKLDTENKSVLRLKISK